MMKMENEMNVNVPLEIIKASEIEPKEVKWLWYPYIPFGKVTLLQGDPGDGKSKLMLSIAALLSKGEPLPFTEEETEPMTVIYQTTEDDADGYFQQYGTYARMSDEPDFQYLGGGAVTFRLETEDGIIYNYTITISIDDSNVNFKAEDDLPK